MSVAAESSSRVMIGSDVVLTIHLAAQLVYPEEACGLLLGQWGRAGEVTIRQAVMVPNTARGDRAHRYTIDPRLMLEWERLAQRSGMTIVGFFHSHPDNDPRPSGTDAALAWPSYAYVIVSVTAPTAGSAKPLVTGMAAWTFDEASSRFTEVPVTVQIADDQIEYFI